MYIQDRLFSEAEEEVLYSVLMNEDEYALFCEVQREFAKIPFSGFSAAPNKNMWKVMKNSKAIEAGASGLVTAPKGAAFRARLGSQSAGFKSLNQANSETITALRAGRGLA